MVKNNICLKECKQANALFQKMCPKKRTHALNVYNRLWLLYILDELYYVSKGVLISSMVSGLFDQLQIFW